MTSMAYAQSSYTSPTPPPLSSSSMAKPSIRSLEPAKAAIGSSVTIMGSNFKNVKKVLFNGTQAKFTVVSDTEIRATVPTAAKSGPVEIVTDTGTFPSTVQFQVGTGY